MNIIKRRKTHLTTVKTARSIAGLLIVFGFAMLILSATVSTFLFLTDNSEATVGSVLDSVLPDTGQQIDVEPTGTRGDVAKFSLDSRNIQTSIGNSISALDWNHLWRLLAGAFMSMWLGYVLRVLAVLAETQLIDFQKGV